MILSLELANPRALELFPLIFAYNHISTEVARALRVGDMENVVSLRIPFNELRHELERRGRLGYFLKLKSIESQRLKGQLDKTQGGPDERNLN